MSIDARYDSLYLHVPFCKNICDYCKLYSLVENSDLVRSNYLKKMELDLIRSWSDLTSLKTVFIGGGTPSSLTLQEMKTLLIYLILV